MERQGPGPPVDVSTSPGSLRSGRRAGLRGDDAAAGTVTSFIVAVGVFMVAFSLATVYLAGFAEQARTAAAVDLDPVADDALSLALGGPGVPMDWETMPGSPNRCGLLQVGTSSTVDLDKLRRFHPSDEQVPYDDARTCLGLSPDEDLHLRTRPNFEGDAALGGYRLAYLGHYDASLLGSGWIHDEESNALVDLPVAYNDTEADEPVSVDGPGDRFRDNATWMSKHLGPGLAGFRENLNEAAAVERLVGEGDTHWHIVDLDHYRGDGVTWDADERFVLTTSVENPDWQGANPCADDDKCYFTYADGATDRMVVTRVDLTDADAAWFNFTHYADGTESGAHTGHDRGRVVYRTGPGDGWDPIGDGATVEYDGGSTNKEHGETSSFVEESRDISHLTGQTIEIAFEWIAETSTSPRRGMGWFVGGVQVEAVTDGERSVLYDNGMDLRTSRYDVLYVGSDVNQSVLAGDDDVRTTVQGWVDAGGDVLATGGTGLNRSWVQPFASGEPSPANGPLLEGESDLSHPLLTTPWALPHRTWEPGADTYGVRDSDTFTKVLLREDGSGESRPLLSVSNPNPTYDGDLALTSWTPYNFTGEDDRARFYTNTLLYLRYREIYLDYGATVPPGTSVGSASSRGLVDASDLDLGYINFRTTMYVWR